MIVLLAAAAGDGLGVCKFVGSNGFGGVWLWGWRAFCLTVL